MIKKVVNSKGGLHNRLTRKIRLLPFTLHETEQYLKSNNIHMDRYQMLNIFMAMGGVPHYLKELKKGESANQAIDSFASPRMAFFQQNSQTFTALCSKTQTGTFP